MSELMIKCRCCAAELFFADDEQTQRCGFCRTVNPRPQSQGDTLNILNLAVEQRGEQDFFHAEESYRRVLEQQKDEYEARWGLALCKYGVEYVRDPRTGRQLPVCHTVRMKPMREDYDYRQAIALAPSDVREGYEADAAYIDAAQQRIRELEKSDQTYDVFLCYKETALTSNDATEESLIARRLYNSLTHKGYKVFFAPESLNMMIGENYEAGIYHAIEAARVMLVVGTRPDHLTSAWVQSEWSRYLERIDNGEDKYLIPLFGKMPASNLPQPFLNRSLQGLSMDTLAWEEILDSTLLRLFRRPAPQPVPEPQPAPAPKPVPEQRPAPAPQPAPVQQQEPPKQTGGMGIPEGINPTQYTDEKLFKTKDIDKNSVAIVKFTGSGSVVVVPPTISGKRVTTFGKVTFFTTGVGGLQNVEAVVLPDTVETIGNSAFMACKSLKTVVLPDSVKQICQSAFSGASMMEKIRIPRGVTKIETGAFDDCSRLKDVELPEGMTEIGYGAFENCTSLKEIRLPESLMHIESVAFRGCAKLEKIGLPEGLKTIGEEAFAGCGSLEEICLPERVEMIGASAFENCKNLKRFTFPDNVPEIGLGDKIFGDTHIPEAIFVKRGSRAEEYVRENYPQALQYK